MTGPTWHDEDAPELLRPTGAGWVRTAVRGVLLAITILLGLLVLLLIRLVEPLLFGEGRPWTSRITVMVCRMALVIMGIRVVTSGRPMVERGAIVANHASWLDIFVLNAAGPVFFVSKAEVAAWPGIGHLARATGTVFIRRARGDAAAQRTVFEDRLSAGHRLLFFPEGTSTDGLRVLPFKPTLFAAFFSDGLQDMAVQPVTVSYHAPDGADPRFYGWWGDMDFAPHLLQVLAAPRQGSVEVTWHTPLKIADFADRKSLAAEADRLVRSHHISARQD